MGQSLMTAQELSESLNLSVRWIYYATRNNMIPFWRFGRQVRFNLEEVLASPSLRSLPFEQEYEVVASAPAGVDFPEPLEGEVAW